MKTRKRRLQRSDLFWLIAVALLVLLQFWWLPGDPGTPDDTYSNTIEGKLGFFQTLQSLADSGRIAPVRRESALLIPQERKATLLILSPDRYPNAHEETELATFVRNGGALVFAPNWAEPKCSISSLGIKTQHEHFSQQNSVVTTASTPAQGRGPKVPTESDPQQPGSSSDLPAEMEDPADSNVKPNSKKTPPVSTPRTTAQRQPRRRDIDPQQARDVLEDAIRRKPGIQPTPAPTITEVDDDENFRDVADLSTESELVEGRVPWRTRASMSTGSKPAVLVRSSEGTTQAAAWQHGNGLVLLSASADVFSNRAMLDQAQAELAIRIVEYAHEHNKSAEAPIVISEFLNASDAYRGTAVLMSPALRSGTLQLLTVALLAGWFGFHRFGPAIRSNTSERRSLTESASAVGNLFFRTQSGGEAVKGYVEYTRTQFQRVFGNSVQLDDTAMIAARTGLDPDDVQSRLQNAKALAGARTTTAPQAAAAIRDLAEILGRLTGHRDEKT